MLSYEQILRAGAARIGSSGSITRKEWHEFIAYLRLDERFPGIQSIGFAERVKAGDRAAHAKRLRAEGFPEYDIRPPGDRPEYFPIVLNEPFVGRNTRVIGYDMFAEPTRKAAMERARDAADAGITGKVILAGEAFRGEEAAQPGFVMYVPVYREQPGALGRDERATALAGYVFSPFRMHDLMRGILDAGVLQMLDMRIYDEATATSASELIDTRTAWRASPPAAAEPAFSRRSSLLMPGRAWVVQFTSRPEFDAIQGTRPWALLGAGLGASALVFVLAIALVAAWNRAHHLSMRDPLTGLYNRRYLEETMARELPRARRLGESTGVIVIDLDHFKRLNDTFGHDAGDYVLERTGDLLRAATRNSDIACRFGGEEFAVILPGATLQIARNRAEAIRSALEALKLDFGGLPLGALTLSAGVAALSPHGPGWTEAVHQADRALYAAKQAGRNRVLAAT
jgi:diguanylate cyclase (GGDEF)-like protein